MMANSTSLAADSRTWVIDPAADGWSAEVRVWIESTANRAGFISLVMATIASTELSVAR